MTPSATAYIALGANLGDRLRFLRTAVDALGEQDVVRIDRATGFASLYETAPVGGPAGQSAYLNSVVRITTRLSPLELLRLLQAVERSLGRTRPPIRHAPRNIDLDLLLHGALVHQCHELTLPHPRLHLRRFVLEPLAEIAPGLVHPVLGTTIAQLAAELRDASPDEKVDKVIGPEWSFEPAATAAS